MTSAEYQRICDRLARKAIHFAAKMVADEDLSDRIHQAPLVMAIEWIVYRCLPGMPESVAGAVTAVDWEEAWTAAVEKYGERVNHVAPEAREPGTGGTKPKLSPSDEQREHWIHVFLDEHLPDIDADALLEVTPRADAWDKSGGHRCAGKEVRATAAFQADVWAAINRMEKAAP